MSRGHGQQERPQPRPELDVAEEREFETDTDQRLVNVHRESDQCHLYGCALHAPSDHHMVGWKLRYRSDRNLLERICKHGVGHPDPDHISWVRRTAGDKAAEVQAVHGCDGCCLAASVS